MLRSLFALILLAGCAVPPALLEASDVPPPRAASIALVPLDPVDPPTLPPALRAEAAPQGAAMHVQRPRSKRDSSSFVAALDAYLSVQNALASDDLVPIAAHARRFVEAWSRAIDEAPDGDPHLWHVRASETATVGAQALALAEASDLPRARMAFGHLSAPFAALVEAYGVPAGISRFTCGMQADLPENGVWLQRGDAPRNPYYGAQMLTCAVRDVETSTPGRPAEATAPGRHSGSDGHDG